MDCRQFDSEIQRQLDLRSELQLSSDAMAHRLVCNDCDQYWQLYQSMDNGAHFGLATPLQAALKPMDFNKFLLAPIPDDLSLENTDLSLESASADGINLDEVKEDFAISNKAKSQDEILVAEVVAEPVDANQTTRSPHGVGQLGRGSGRFISWAAGIAAVLLLSIGIYSGIDEPSRSPGSSTALTTNSDGTPRSSVPENSSVSVKDAMATTKKAPENSKLNRPNSLDANFAAIQDSFYIFDRQWQSYGATAQSIPGLHPAVAPIGGTVEAIRQNLLADDGNRLKQ